MTKEYYFNIRLFDNTQKTTTNDTGNDLSPEMKTYYSDYLIDLVGPALVHDQFAQKVPIPKNGGKNIEFRKYSPLAKALTPLTEGVTPAGQKLNVSTINATVDQYGGYIELSDMLLLTAIDNNLVQATQLLGDQAGRTLDTITREVLNGGTNVVYQPIVLTDSETEVTSRNELTADCKLTLETILKAVAYLKSMNARPCDGGFYGCIMHPLVAYDIMTQAKANNTWWDAYKYASPENLLSGEIGKFGGARIVETSESKIWANAGKNGESVYSTLVIGANAYGVTEISDGGLEHIVKQLGSGGTSDALNQRATTGWKATKVAERLVEEYMVRIESCSTFKSTAAN
ncbi:MAG: N4-gp56 family major capsid protein [Clostridia bacterium]|jgi:N4-gp56 family major capsid protein|nr:N4-gp56 family major capsid protein [Clostridia bacterium]